MEKRSTLEMIVVLACPAGRVGSSAIMGALDLGGYTAGRAERMIRGGGMNPKGFFELRSQERLLRRVFRGYYPGPTVPPRLDVVLDRCKRYMKEFRCLMHSEFSGEKKIAIKAPRWLTIPFYEQLHNDVDIRIVSLERDLDKQVRSTYRVWQQTHDPILMAADNDQIKAWIRSWQEFADAMRSRYEAILPVYGLSFDELMSDPVAQSSQLLHWLGVPSPGAEALQGWFDSSLVERQSLPPITRLEALKRGLKRRVQNAVRRPYTHYSPYIVR